MPTIKREGVREVFHTGVGMPARGASSPSTHGEPGLDSVEHSEKQMAGELAKGYPVEDGSYALRAGSGLGRGR